MVIMESEGVSFGTEIKNLEGQYLKDIGTLNVISATTSFWAVVITPVLKGVLTTTVLWPTIKFNIKKVK